ncbi:hypothetical protein [Promicromonospora panici]|uniref:hypothetical protein n=1 Tax=Promicromonospora panici TaxID=2219658 RepID=UPI00101CC03E|nr:hypothetical protein [Promicromonospora panici]
MSTTRSSLRAGVVVIAPVIWLAVLSYHPYLAGRLPNLEAIAHAVESDPTRWGAVHLATGVASGVLALAFLAVRAHLHEAGEDRWSAAALPFVVIGCTLYAMLPGLEFAPLAAVEAGGDVEAAQEALLPWFAPLLVAAGVTFAVGMFGFALGVRRSGLLSPGVTSLVMVALGVMALSRLVPLSAVQFYVQGVAGLVALLPLAGSMWKQRAAAVPARQPAPQAT